VDSTRKPASRSGRLLPRVRARVACGGRGPNGRQSKNSVLRSSQRAYLALVLLLGTAALIDGCGGGGYPSPRVAGQQTTRYPPQPVPGTGPLARPRSLQQPGLPVEATRATIPRDNPQTSEKIDLGQKLFFDGRLSVDDTVACSTCHDPARAFTDGNAVSVGIKGRTGQRNAPTILNALYNKTQFWDGRAQTLEDQAVLPIVNPSEMGQPSLDAAVARIASVKEYRKAFARVFGRPPNGLDLVSAVASYERTQVSYDSPFDHFVAGDQRAIDTAARRGWALFNSRGRCNKCHALSQDRLDVTNFTDNGFHNIGVMVVPRNVVAMAHLADESVKAGDMVAVDRAAIQTDMSVLGRFLVTRRDSDIGAFKTPNLRNLLMTAPYFHDGSHETLWDVLDHYNKGGRLGDPNLDHDMQPLGLTERDIEDVISFLASLTSPDYRKPALKELARQRKLSRTTRPYRDNVRAFASK
jgi:cytochrome c peroxidase